MSLHRAVRIGAATVRYRLSALDYRPTAFGPLPLTDGREL